MGGLFLCHGKLAKIPFLVEGTHTNIYSLEELCYYIKHNIYLIDEEILSEELCDWIEEALDKGKLAAKIRDFIGKPDGLKKLLRAINQETGYYPVEEVQRLVDILVATEGQTKEARLKCKGDSYMANRQNKRAIQIYSEILRNAPVDWPREHQAAIWNNIGAAYAGLFLFPRAAEAFRKSYDLEPAEETCMNYLCAQRFTTPVDTYARVIEDEDIDPQIVVRFEKLLAEINESEKESSMRKRISAAEKDRREGRITKSCREFDEIVNEWKKEYRDTEA